MSAPGLVLLVFVGGIAVAVARALVVDEAKGQLRRRTAASVERTIDSMSLELQEEWAEEWRADLAKIESMPFTALRFAANLRRTARELTRERELATVAETALGARGRRAFGESSGPRRAIARLTAEAASHPATFVARIILAVRAMRRLALQYPRTVLYAAAVLSLGTAAQALVKIFTSDTRVAIVIPGVLILLAALVGRRGYRGP